MDSNNLLFLFSSSFSRESKHKLLLIFTIINIKIKYTSLFLFLLNSNLYHASISRVMLKRQEVINSGTVKYRKESKYNKTTWWRCIMKCYSIYLKLFWKWYFYPFIKTNLDSFSLSFFMKPNKNVSKMTKRTKQGEILRET